MFFCTIRISHDHSAYPSPTRNTKPPRISEITSLTQPDLACRTYRSCINEPTSTPLPSARYPDLSISRASPPPPRADLASRNLPWPSPIAISPIVHLMTYIAVSRTKTRSVHPASPGKYGKCVRTVSPAYSARRMRIKSKKRGLDYLTGAAPAREPIGRWYRR